jgi:hypothetical protein
MTAPTLTPAQLASVHQEQVLIRQQAGALFEHDVLLVLSELVLSGASIVPEFQALANAVMAKAIIDEKLPPKRRGQPKAAGVKYDPEVLTEQYFDLLDAGMPAQECAAELAERYKLGEKQIGRVVKDNSWLFGDTKAHRDQRRRDPDYRGIDEVKPDDGNIALAGLDEAAALKKLSAFLRGA